MKTKLYIISFATLLFCAFTFNTDIKNMENPFFKEWKTPFKTPPFDEIKTEHYLPAFEEGIKTLKAEIIAIADNEEKATFLNTIEAMEKSGELLTNVNKVFAAVTSANTTDELQVIAEKTAEMLSKSSDDIYLNPKLFARVKAVWDDKNKIGLTTEQKLVLENYYLSFTLGGANLDETGKSKLRKINEELSRLVVKFGDNIRKENSKFELVVDKKTDLAGIPESMVNSAEEKAKVKGLVGKWIFTIDKPTLLPFLELSEKRDLREKMYKAYMMRGNNNDELDNKNLYSKIISLRVQKANILGYKRYSELVLQRKMAKTPENVYKFLYDVWQPTLKRAKVEVSDMQTIIDKDGGKFNLEAWDWWYYAAKVKKEKYSLDEEMLRPYFKLENVIAGAFDVATKLWGVTFTPMTNVSVYHADVAVFEVKEKDGKHLGVLYTDYFPRESKTSGAWCGAFRDQLNLDGKFVSPLIYNVGNFSKPSGDKPALISVDEVRTLFHEFGHGLHGLFQNVKYPSGGSVPSDFVELPSQIMENWAMQPEVLKMYAKHFKTGEVIPQSLIEKIQNSQYFNQGFETLEYIAASILDMDWHSISDATEVDVLKFEAQSIKKMGLIPQILPRYMSTNFIHIATWGYEAGYYSYLWSAVLDSDAFESFEQNGLFDKATAESFRNNILSKGGSDDLMKLYKIFKGREPKVEALLKKRGLN